MDPVSRSKGPRALLPAALYLFLTLAWTWPLPLYLSDRIAHDPGDPLLVTYLLWWNARVVPLSDAMWNPPFYWPMRDPLALTEHGAGMGIVSSPIQWLGGSPVLAYNVLLILATWWSALAAHALVRRLTGSTSAAICAGIAFAFAPYRASQLAHLHLLVTWWIPLVLLALHAYYEEGRKKWLALFGVSWLLQSLTNGYYMFFLPVLIGVWMLAFTPWRTQRRRAVAVAATWLVFSLPLVPMLLKYYTVQHRLGLGRSRLEMRDFSANLKSFFDRSDMLQFWPASQTFVPEAQLFAGLTPFVVLGAALLLARRAFTRNARYQMLFYLGTAVLMSWLALGPPVDPWSMETVWRAYGWIAWLPGFSGLRVPARFYMMATICIAVAIGLAVAALSVRFPRYRLAIAIVTAAGLMADGWVEPMPLIAPPRLFADTVDKNARVLELPVTDERVNINALYRGMLHRVPVVNGYAGYTPPHARVIGWSLFREDASVLTELRRGHPLYVVVSPGAESTIWSRFMDAQPDATMIGVSGAGRVYLMPATAYPPQVDIGAPLKAQRGTSGDGWLTYDLGTAATLRAIELRTEGNLRNVRELLRAETSEDGQTWSLAAEERPGGPALAGALAKPLDVPLRLLLPQPHVRFIRLNAPAFNLAEVTIYGTP